MPRRKRTRTIPYFYRAWRFDNVDAMQAASRAVTAMADAWKLKRDGAPMIVVRITVEYARAMWRAARKLEAVNG